MYIVEIYVSEDRTVHFLWVHLCLLFPADPDVFRNILEFLFHFQVRSQKTQKSVVGPCSSSWGSHGPCHLFVVPHSDCFLLGFSYDGTAIDFAPNNSLVSGAACALLCVLLASLPLLTGRQQQPSLLPVLTNTDVSRRCQMFTGWQNWPQLRTTGLDQRVPKCQRTNAYLVILSL